MRLDRWLVERGFFATREKARQAIAGGKVHLNGKPAIKPAQPVSGDAAIVIREPLRYVSRGGEKLEQAIKALGLQVKGLVALDTGASTGGFTDCLLQHGAAKVYAVDVGNNQLAERLRLDPRVVAMEQTDIRRVTEWPQPVDLVVADLSFISLTKVLDALVQPLRRGGQLLALVKPQFEQQQRIRFKQGIIKKPELQQQAVARVVEAAVAHHLQPVGTFAVGGTAGRNREFFVLFTYDKSPDSKL
ncbi:MAG: TlyA family RNA methyltransferase [Chitinophagales bacterium]|nr:TlyA family RNA methyltransferase [Chitinophagales bacterium]MDW8393872.1 TlyA family RNA methyltransferase [Chitinophagales bacterium]